MGILILFFLAVGAGTIVYYVGKGMVKLYRKFHPRDVNAVTGVTELQIEISQWETKPLPNNRPRNPAYKKFEFATLEYKAIIVKRIEEIEKMPAWDRYVMDLKDGMLSASEAMNKLPAFNRFCGYGLEVLLVMFCIAKPGLLMFFVPLFLYFYVWTPATGKAAARWSFKNVTSLLSPEAMEKVYERHADSQARIAEMRTAIQSSGCIRRVGRW